MKIKEVTVGRVFNLGNYQTMRIEMKAEIQEELDEDPVKVADLINERIKTARKQLEA